MNEGYPLTDYTLKELSLMCVAFEELNKIQTKSIEDNPMDYGLAMSTHKDIEMVREMWIRAKTAFSIVQQREKVSQS